MVKKLAFHFIFNNLPENWLFKGLKNWLFKGLKNWLFKCFQGNAEKTRRKRRRRSRQWRTEAQTSTITVGRSRCYHVWARTQSVITRRPPHPATSDRRLKQKLPTLIWLKGQKWMLWEPRRPTLIKTRMLLCTRKTVYRVRWSGYDRTGDTWEPITHLQGYFSMVKAFKESHEKDVERLAADRWCEVESKEAHALKNAPKHTVLCMKVWTLYMFQMVSGGLSLMSGLSGN